MPLFQLSHLTPREIMPGFHGRMIHTRGTTHAYWHIDEGATLPEHAHPHEQIVNMLEGTFELVVDGEPHQLQAGQVFVIPPQAPHSGRALTACRILDVFQPVREDYR